jgi:hypothetical protein
MQRLAGTFRDLQETAKHSGIEEGSVPGTNQHIVRHCDAACCRPCCFPLLLLLLLQLPDLLSPTGHAFIVTVTENRPQGELLHTVLVQCDDPARRLTVAHYDTVTAACNNLNHSHTLVAALVLCRDHQHA